MNTFKAGKHVIGDFSGIDPEKLKDEGYLETGCMEAARKAGATIVGSKFHSFGEGQGITGVVLLAESHISIHTWPETGYAAVDVFMCGDMDPGKAMRLIQAWLAPDHSFVETIVRSGRHV